MNIKTATKNNHNEPYREYLLISFWHDSAVFLSLVKHFRSWHKIQLLFVLNWIKKFPRVVIVHSSIIIQGCLDPGISKERCFWNLTSWYGNFQDQNISVHLRTSAGNIAITADRSIWLFKRSNFNVLTISMTQTEMRWSIKCLQHKYSGALFCFLKKGFEELLKHFAIWTIFASWKLLYFTPF